MFSSKQVCGEADHKFQILIITFLHVWLLVLQRWRRYRSVRFRYCYPAGYVPTQSAQQNDPRKRHHGYCSAWRIPICSWSVQHSTQFFQYLSCSHAVETVEPGNDRSLESWTDCPVILFIFLIFVPLASDWSVGEGIRKAH